MYSGPLNLLSITHYLLLRLVSLKDKKKVPLTSVRYIVSLQYCRMDMYRYGFFFLLHVHTHLIHILFLHHNLYSPVVPLTEVYIRHLGADKVKHVAEILK